MWRGLQGKSTVGQRAEKCLVFAAWVSPAHESSRKHPQAFPRKPLLELGEEIKWNYNLYACFGAGTTLCLLRCWEKAAKGELTWDVTLIFFAPAAPAG